MSTFIISTNKNDVTHREAIGLWTTLNWGVEDDYNENSVRKALDNTSFLAFARNARGQLVGLVRVLSDGVIYTAIADIAIHPDYRNQGVGTALMEEVKKRYKGIGIFLEGFKESEQFFIKCGYIKRDNMVVFSKKF